MDRLVRLIGRDQFERWLPVNSDMPPTWSIMPPFNPPARLSDVRMPPEPLRPRVFVRTPYDSGRLASGFAYVEDGEPLPARLGPTAYDERERDDHERTIARLRAAIEEAIGEIDAGNVGGFVRAAHILTVAIERHPTPIARAQGGG